MKKCLSTLHYTSFEHLFCSKIDLTMTNKYQLLSSGLIIDQYPPSRLMSAYSVWLWCLNENINCLLFVSAIQCYTQCNKAPQDTSQWILLRTWPNTHITAHRAAEGSITQELCRLISECCLNRYWMFGCAVLGALIIFYCLLCRINQVTVPRAYLLLQFEINITALYLKWQFSLSKDKLFQVV